MKRKKRSEETFGGEILKAITIATERAARIGYQRGYTKALKDITEATGALARKRLPGYGEMLTRKQLKGAGR